ncbi:MAG: hypothetical protein ACRCR2_07905 [Fusobacteriaceae bacterium]
MAKSKGSIMTRRMRMYRNRMSREEAEAMMREKQKKIQEEEVKAKKDVKPQKNKKKEG